MHGHSGSIGSFTFTTISARAHTSAALGTSVAPPAPHASSPNPHPNPPPLLHQHRVPVAYQRLDPRGHQRHTVLGGFDLFGHTNDHWHSGLTSFTSFRDVSP